MDRNISAGRIWAARIIAVAADVIQLTPVLWGGGLNPLNNAIDVVVAVLLSWLVGFHWAFLPSFVMELIPIVDFAPTWTIAVMIATRKDSTELPSTGPIRTGKRGKVIDVEVEK